MCRDIHQTEGIVLSRGNFGEAEAVFTLFTEQFGKIKAAARGVRHLKSKLRFNLGLFSFGRFSLLAGGTENGRFWKILDVEEIPGARRALSSERKLALFARAASLLDRMVQGEEKNPFLWGEIGKLLNLPGGEEIGAREMENIEISFLLRVLGNLGYIGEDLEKLAAADPRAGFGENRRLAVSAINTAIKESML